MDDRTRETMQLIQLALALHLETGAISVADAGKQLILVARDYIEAGENEAAWEVLAQCDESYFREYLPQQRRDDKFFDNAAAVVDEVFALAYFRADVQGSA